MTTFIHLRGCRQHNLKDLSIDIPKGRWTVITGVSGAGKSSLAFDTLFTEGQRLTIECLSPSAKALIKQLPRPDVDLIEGLSPTLAIRSHPLGADPRNTIATLTDLHDLLSVLYATIGVQHSPTTGEPLSRQTSQQILVALLSTYRPGARLQILAPLTIQPGEIAATVQQLQQQGFVRYRIDDQEFTSDQPPPAEASANRLWVVVDRIVMKEGIESRLRESIATSLKLGRGIMYVQEGTSNPLPYTEVFLCAATGERFKPLQPADFNFFSRQGACPVCLGRTGAECPLCRGAKLKTQSLHCKVAGIPIQDLSALTVSEALKEIQCWRFKGQAKAIAGKLLPPIEERLELLIRFGLDYLELNRPGGAISVGEAQRVQLAAQIGTKLSGVTYILDEPSRGLHAKDVILLAQILKELCDNGNTLIAVEHHRMLIEKADLILELGPGSGPLGGKLIFSGTPKTLKASPSATGRWLKKKPVPAKHKTTLSGPWLEVHNASLHNLQCVSTKIPLGKMTALCGVSGSGKSSLAIHLIGTEMKLWISSRERCAHLSGYESLRRLVMVEQEEGGISVRSLPATYVGIMTPLRELFAQTRLAQARGYPAAYFSLSRPGGRCEVCEGRGVQRVALKFMPDLATLCEVCQGQRYNFEALQVTWEGYTIADVLAMTAAKAADLLQAIPHLHQPLDLMTQLGLDYLTLGQPLTTLSRGEIQRLKLLSELAKGSQLPTLYILDEPSAGLHFSEVAKLLTLLRRLVSEGHTLLLIEHNPDLLSQADWLLELGPGAGPRGGTIVFTDTPTHRAQ